MGLINADAFHGSRLLYEIKSINHLKLNGFFLK